MLSYRYALIATAATAAALALGLTIAESKLKIGFCEERESLLFVPGKKLTMNFFCFSDSMYQEEEGASELRMGACASLEVSEHGELICLG